MIWCYLQGHRVQPADGVLGGHHGGAPRVARVALRVRDQRDLKPVRVVEPEGLCLMRGADLAGLDTKRLEVLLPPADPCLANLKRDRNRHLAALQVASHGIRRSLGP